MSASIMTVKGRLQEADEFILESDIRTQNDTIATTGTGINLAVYSGQTITAYVKSIGVPGTSTYPVLNCTVDSQTTSIQKTTGHHFSIVKISFGSSSNGSFQCYINTTASNKIFQISGTYSTSTSTDAVQPMSLGNESGAKFYNNVGLIIEDNIGETISMNDTDVRTLAEETTGSSLIRFGDLYGKEHNLGGIPVTYTGTNSYTDTAIPSHSDLGGTGSSSTTITNNPLLFVRRVKLTYSGTSASKYLHISAQRANPAIGQYFHGDAQIFGYSINGTFHDIDTFGSTTTTNSGWKTKSGVNPTTTDPDDWHNSTGSELSVLHNRSGTDGKFTIFHTNAYNSGRTGSGGTGRIPNPFLTSLTGDNVGYGYFETSGGSIARMVGVHYHARSPSFSLDDGDTVEVWYGVDCASLDFIKFDIIGLS